MSINTCTLSLCWNIKLHKKWTKHKLINSKKESMQSLICGWNSEINVLRGYLEVSIPDVFKMCYNWLKCAGASGQDSTKISSSKIIFKKIKIVDNDTCYFCDSEIKTSHPSHYSIFVDRITSVYSYTKLFQKVLIKKKHNFGEVPLSY